MAQKVIMVSEQEIADLKTDIIKNVHKFSKKPYGFKMVSRETGKEITDIMHICGMLSGNIDDAIEKMLKSEK